MKNRLSNAVTQDLNTLEGAIATMVFNVEDGALKAGAVPGTDYTMRDLIGWAMPFVLGGWNSNPEMTAANEWLPWEQREDFAASMREAIPKRAEEVTQGGETLDEIMAMLDIPQGLGMRPWLVAVLLNAGWNRIHERDRTTGETTRRWYSPRRTPV